MHLHDHQDPASVLRHFCRTWAERDLKGALAYIHDDVVYSMFIPQDVVPFGGETHGKASMADRLRMILAQFDTVRFESTVVRSNDQSARAQVTYAFQHKATRETVEGQMRLIAQFVEGRIIDLKEYHDLEKIRAFMRLVSYVATNIVENDC